MRHAALSRTVSLRAAPGAVRITSGPQALRTSQCLPLCTTCLFAGSPLREQQRAFRIVSLDGNDPAPSSLPASAQATGTAATTVLKAPDPTLVALPPGVGQCVVFRSVLSAAEEERIYEELAPLMALEGSRHYAEASKVDEKRLRNVYIEMYGTEKYTELKNWKKKETKQVPGFRWAPTLVRWLERVEGDLMHWLRAMGLPPTAVHGLAGDGAAMRALGEGADEGLLEGAGCAVPAVPKPDARAGPIAAVSMGRIVEHHDCGYEMHVEHPTVGRYFLYLNLLSETVLAFDDEATGRRGQVYLPERSLMLCASELRWGWRFGEHPQPTKTFEGTFRKTVTPDLRLSVQLWDYDPRLVDRRHLQAQLERAVRASGLEPPAAPGLVDGDAAASTAIKVDAMAFSQTATAPDPSKKALNLSETTRPNPATVASAATVGMGKLGGDFVPDVGAVDGGSGTGAAGGEQKDMAALDKDYRKYKDSFSRITQVLGDMKAREDGGQKIDEAWIADRMRFEHGEQADEYGFDAANPEGTWEHIENKARFYRDKIRSMDYYGTNSGGGTDSSKGKGSQATGSVSSQPSSANEGVGSLDEEVVIEGLSPAGPSNGSAEKSAEQRKAAADSPSSPDNGPVNLREAFSKLLPKDRADQILSRMPNSLGGQARPPRY